jgi:hypothetical protein
LIKEKISSTFEDKVDFNSEVDCFMDLVAYTIKVLISGIMEKLEITFKTMQNMNWSGGSSNQVG